MDFKLSLGGVAVSDFNAQVQTSFKTAFAGVLNVDPGRVVITSVNGVAYTRRRVCGSTGLWACTARLHE